MNTDCPDVALDAFREAAMSVTKLFKTGAAAQAKAHGEGYQDCLSELLSFLNKERIGQSDNEASRVRAWVMERIEGGDGGAQTVESEDEVDKAETASSPEPQQTSSATQLPATQDGAMQTDSPPEPVQLTREERNIVVPSQETFSFASPIPYPQDTDLALANLDLSDSHTPHSNVAPPAAMSIKPTRLRLSGSGARSSTRQLGRGAGLKRKLNLVEIFDVGSLGYGKDMFGGRGGKRRHI